MLSLSTNKQVRCLIGKGGYRFSPPVVLFVVLVDFFPPEHLRCRLTMGLSLSKIYQSAVCTPPTSLTSRIQRSVYWYSSLPELVRYRFPRAEQSFQGFRQASLPHKGKIA